MKWVLLKGDPLQSSPRAPRSTGFEIPQLKTEGEPPIYQIKICAWNFDNPPSRETEEMYEVCIVEVDLTNVEDIATKQAAPGSSFKVVNCELEINTEDYQLAFRVLVGGREVGKVLGKDM